MFTKAAVKAKEQFEVTEFPAPIELAPEQLEEVSGGCLYGHGVWGPTLILPVLVAILIG